MPEIIVENLCKRFGDVVAVDHINFTVQDGEFLTLLGPSGCGKSTTLFAIAGLDRPDSGLIRVGDSTFFDSDTGHFIVPEKRNCGMVFQSYALWPHMNVYENLAFSSGSGESPSRPETSALTRSWDWWNWSPIRIATLTSSQADNNSGWH